MLGLITGLAIDDAGNPQFCCLLAGLCRAGLYRTALCVQLCCLGHLTALHSLTVACNKASREHQAFNLAGLPASVEEVTLSALGGAQLHTRSSFTEQVLSFESWFSSASLPCRWNKVRICCSCY